MPGKKQTKGSVLSQDLDIFNLGDEDEEVSLDSDIFWAADDTTGETDTTNPEPTVEASTEEVIPEETTTEELKPELDLNKEGTEETQSDDAELQKRLDDLKASSENVDEKVDELKEEVDKSWNEQMSLIVTELQKALEERDSTIKELTTKYDVLNSKFIEKIWDSENITIYKDVIQNLESDPKLMMLVKYANSDNEKIQDRVINILWDMIYKIKWIDVLSLLEEWEKNKVASALNPAGGTGEPWPGLPEVEDKNMNFEDSINQLF